MINEVIDLTYICTGSATADGFTSDCPYYTNGKQQLEYYGYESSESAKWLDLLILWCFLLLFTILGLVFYHFVRYDIQASAATNKTQPADDETQATSSKPDVLNAEAGGQQLRASLAFNDLTYDVPIPTEDGQGTRQLRLLQGCYGYFNPGTATALMGSSGAGKSTLMDVLAGMKTGGTIRGDVFICHEPVDKIKEGPESGAVILDTYFRRYVGYVEQSDIHMETQTVREAFTFSARTRLPTQTQDLDGAKPVTAADQDQMVEYTLDMLELRQSADIQISDLDSQEKKRCTMGVELAGGKSLN